MPEKIEKQVNKIKNCDLDNLVFIYCQMELYDDRGKLVGITKNHYRGNEEPFQANMVKCIAGHLQS
ncbi:MAG: hypothetical protein PHO63_04360 [Bacilli bacterium]|nr:hypothetical protein [Bacilli bacterium]MDD4808867.1 hypothetical protein [Bacilli bacterium]